MSRLLRRPAIILYKMGTSRNYFWEITDTEEETDDEDDWLPIAKPPRATHPLEGVLTPEGLPAICEI